jgi:hypothetical protein
VVNAGNVPWPTGKFNRRDVAASTFSRETAPISNEEKRAIARLVKCKPDDAETRAPDFVTKLREAQAKAFGAAPHPQATPHALIDELASLSGRDLVKRLAEEETTASQLLASLEAQAAKIIQREPAWQQLEGLITYLDGQPEKEAIVTEHDAIRDGRLLLDDPDKVAPLLNHAADALRVAVNDAFSAYGTQYDAAISEIEAAPEWVNLLPEDRTAILRDTHLQAPDAAPKLGTLDELIGSLGLCSVGRWAEKRDALRGQTARALTLAAKKIEPTVQAVSPPRRILRSEVDLDPWLADVRQAVLEKLPEGPVQI